MKAIQVPDYQLFVKCGRGAYGDVYIAKSLSGSMVAMKIIEKDAYSAKEFDGLKYYCSRCTNSPYLIKIFHVGETESFFYYTMELADNIGDENNYIPATLANYLIKNKRLPLPKVIDLTLNLLSGLDTLHRAGLVHRDIKPENVIFVNKTPKLSDVGLVSSVSAAFSLCGTLGFIPPEKLKSSSGSKSATDDLYALGKLIYCVFTGNSPDRFPSIPPDIVLDEKAKRLNEVILTACSKFSHLRFHSIDDFRKALTSSLSKKKKVLNFLWKIRYYSLVGLILIVSLKMVLWLIPSRLEDNKFGAPIEYQPAFVDSRQKSRTDSRGPISSSTDSKSNRNEAVPTMVNSSIIPPVISDHEFKKLMARKVDNQLLMAYVNKVEYYLLDRGSKVFPELKKEFSCYMENLAKIEELMFKNMPEKVAGIKTAVRNCPGALNVPYVLTSFLSPDMWNNKKMFKLFCNCAISSENIAVIFLKKRNHLPVAIEWDKYILASRPRNHNLVKPIYFMNITGEKETDWNIVLDFFKKLLQNSPANEREYNKRRAVRFLANLKSNILTPQIVALENELPPLEIRLAAAMAIRAFAQKNINDYVVYKYGSKAWKRGDLYVQNYLDVKRKTQDNINNLHAVKQLQQWILDRRKKLDSMREMELNNNSNPQVVVYLKAQRVLAPYLNNVSAEPITISK